MVLAGLLAALPALSAGCNRETPEQPAPRRTLAYQFHRDGVLGTSMDLTVCTTSRSNAQVAQEAALAEMERCRKILSTYDPNSEVCRLKSATGPVKVSPELLELLAGYDAWKTRSEGAFSGQLQELIDLWKQAGKTSRLPDEAELARAVQRLAQPAWTLDMQAGTVTPGANFTPNLDAMGKGYIIDKALQAALAKAPSVTGLLLAIGGDMRLWGKPAEGDQMWTIAVTDPANPAENAPPLATLRLPAGALATSGHYERFVTIGQKKYSHILDPRTGRPAEQIASATVIADDCATADALATILCVLPPENGLKLVAQTPGAQCLLVGADAKRYASPGMQPLLVANPATQPHSSSAWPNNYRLSIWLTLPKTRLRPYLAVWIEDPRGKCVKTLAVWGNNPKYMRKLKSWWSLEGNNPDVEGVTRATRPAGKYEVVWTGTDDAGKPLPPGTYTVQIETAREEGPHTRLKGSIECGPDRKRGKIEPNKEVEEILMNYGPAGE